MTTACDRHVTVPTARELAATLAKPSAQNISMVIIQDFGFVVLCSCPCREHCHLLSHPSKHLEISVPLGAEEVTIPGTRLHPSADHPSHADRWICFIVLAEMVALLQTCQPGFNAPAPDLHDLAPINEN